MHNNLTAAQLAGLGLLDFARFMLAELFCDEPAPFQYELADDLEWALQGGMRLLGALPREHGKTSLGTVALIVREACRCWVDEESNQLSVISDQCASATRPDPVKSEQTLSGTAQREPLSSLITDHCSLITGSGAALPSANEAAGLETRAPAKRHILIIGANQREAEAKLALIKHELETNQLVNEYFPGIATPAKGVNGQKTAYRKDEIQLACGMRIAAYGAQGKLRGSLHRGLRPDLALLDDPEDDSGARSQKRRHDLRAWCERTLLPALDIRRGSLVWLGTLLHHDSVLAGWIEERGGRGQAQGARHKAQAGRRKAEGQSEEAGLCLAGEWQGASAHNSTATNEPGTDGPPSPPCALRLEPCAIPPASRWRVCRYPALDEETGVLLWPGRFSRELLEQRRLDMGDPAFAQEYLLRPASAEAQRFRRGDFKNYNADELTEQDGQWRMHGRPLTVVAAMDPASGLKEQHDYSAVAVLGLLPTVAGNSKLQEQITKHGASDQLSVISNQCASATRPDSVNSEQMLSGTPQHEPLSSLITDHCSLITDSSAAAPSAEHAVPFKAYVLEVARIKGRFDDQLRLLDRLAARWHPQLIGIESNAYQAVLQQSASDHGLPVVEVKTSRDKGWRLENLSTAAARGMLFMPGRAQWARAFYDEAEGWPNSRHDDQLDAAAHALVCGGELLERLKKRRSYVIYSARLGADVTGDAGDEGAQGDAWLHSKQQRGQRPRAA